MLKVELASVIIVGVHFVRETYCLEGDSMSGSIAMKKFYKLLLSRHFLNTYSIGCVEPGLLLYFR